MKVERMVEEIDIRNADSVEASLSSSSSSDFTPRAVPPPATSTSHYSFDSTEPPQEDYIRMVASAQDNAAKTMENPIRKSGALGATGESRSRAFSLLDSDSAYFAEENQPRCDDRIDRSKIMECRKLPNSTGKDSATNLMGSYTEALFQSDWLSLPNSGGVMIFTGSQAEGDESCLKLPAVTKSDSSEADDSSVFSSGYFDRTDFVRSNWMKALDGPAFGFAVVALATAIIHPVFFVAGALTAFGVLKAAGASYDCCLEGDEISLQRLLFRDTYLQGEEPTTATSQINKDTKPTPLSGSDNTTISTVTNLSINHELGQHVPNVTSNSIIIPPSAASSTRRRKNEDEIDALKSDVGASISRRNAPTHRSTKQNTSTSSRRILSLDLLNQLYPKLAHEVVKDVEFPGLNAFEFFQVFFADDAPFNFRDLQKKRGDIDIHYGEWETLSEDSTTASHFSLHHEAEIPRKNSAGEGYNYRLFQGRILSFKAHTGGSALFGPAYAITTKAQRVLVVSKRLAIIESKTTLTNIPFCDRFYVLDRWLISAEKEFGRYVSKLSASTQVLFTKRCQFESQIRSKSCTAITDLIKAWCTMAKEALKLTEEQKSNRLLKMEQDHDLDTDVTDIDTCMSHHDDSDTIDAARTSLSLRHEVPAVVAVGVGEGVEIQLENVLANIHGHAQNDITTRLPTRLSSNNRNDKNNTENAANDFFSSSRRESSTKTRKSFRRGLLSKYLGGRQ